MSDQCEKGHLLRGKPRCHCGAATKLSAQEAASRRQTAWVAAVLAVPLSIGLHLTAATLVELAAGQENRSVARTSFEQGNNHLVWSAVISLLVGLAVRFTWDSFRGAARTPRDWWEAVFPIVGGTGVYAAYFGYEFTQAINR